jgi:hypothetical protein
MAGVENTRKTGKTGSRFRSEFPPAMPEVNGQGYTKYIQELYIA